MAVFQNFMDCVGDRTGSYSETCVQCGGVRGTEEISIKEETVDIEDGIPEAITFPSVKTEHEVRLQGVCELAVMLLRPFIATKCKF
jgi:hypothetical protein